MSRTRTLGAAVVAAVLGVSLAAGPTPAQAAEEKTNFTLQASGYGLKVTGGALPANSQNVGHDALGCTSKAGLDKSNTIAGAELPEFGEVSATKTSSRTYKKGNTVTSESVHEVADVTLYESLLGSVKVTAIKSVARASSDGNSFHAEGESSIGKIEATLLGRELPDVKIPAPGKKIKIGLPGMKPLAVIGIGLSDTQETATSATSATRGVWVRVPATDTTVTVARARAHIEDGVPTGFFHGSAQAIDAQALDGRVKVGRTPLQYVKCRGTDGEIVGKEVGDVPLGDVFNGILDVDGLASRQMSDTTPVSAGGWAEGEVAKVSLADGRVVINGLRARANSEWRAGLGITRSDNGTTFGKITFDGEEISLDELGKVLDKLDIPGLLKVDTNVVTYPTKRMIEVVGLQLTVLDFSDATKSVVNIGHARFGASPNR